LVANPALGGGAAVLGGGKFENRAITGAFGYLFNTCSMGKGPCTLGTSGLLDSNTPEQLRWSIERVGADVLATGDQALIARFDAWQVQYLPQITGTVYAVTSYDGQWTRFFGDISRLSPDELDFTAAHEFAHTTPETFSFSIPYWGDAFNFTPSNPVEINANAMARSILQLENLPGIFANRPTRMPHYLICSRVPATSYRSCWGRHGPLQDMTYLGRQA
jgi:hypothetical protein